MKTSMVFAVGTIALALVSISAPVEAATSIRLSIETSTTTLFFADMDVEECSEPSSTTTRTTAYCALEQTGLSVSWTPWGDMMFLESVEGAANDFSSGLSWNWFSDLEYGQVSLDEHELSEGESLLVAIGKMPLKIALSTSTPEIGATTTVSVLEFGFDAGWNPVWLPSASSTLSIAGEAVPVDENGEARFVATSTDRVSALALRTGFISAEATLLPVALASSTEPVEPVQAPGGSSSVRGEETVVAAHRVLDVARAAAFLSASQRDDGSFGSDLYTDWAAIALSALPHSPARDKVAGYLASSAISSGPATEYERRAMALMSLGIDPRTGTAVDYIATISGAFDGEQIGDASLVNDDIFALFPLIKAGFAASDEIVRKTAAFVLSRQMQNGSWENSPDLTAAAIQALSLVSSESGVAGAMASARGYLASLPRGGGGFGNAYSTGWAIQAIYAFGEHPSAWASGTLDPNDYLAGLQREDGGVGDLSIGQNSRVWATAYAIPAALGRTWGSLLFQFHKPPEAQTVSRTDDVLLSVAESASSTVARATSTPAMATSTVAIASEESDIFIAIDALPFLDPPRESAAIDAAEAEPEIAALSADQAPSSLVAGVASALGEREDAAPRRAGFFSIVRRAVRSFISWLF